MARQVGGVSRAWTAGCRGAPRRGRGRWASGRRGGRGSRPGLCRARGRASSSPGRASAGRSCISPCRSFILGWTEVMAFIERLCLRERGIMAARTMMVKRMIATPEVGKEGGVQQHEAVDHGSDDYAVPDFAQDFHGQQPALRGAVSPSPQPSPIKGEGEESPSPLPSPVEGEGVVEGEGDMNRRASMLFLLRSTGDCRGWRSGPTSRRRRSE